MVKVVAITVFIVIGIGVSLLVWVCHRMEQNGIDVTHTRDSDVDPDG